MDELLVTDELFVDELLAKLGTNPNPGRRRFFLAFESSFIDFASFFLHFLSEFTRFFLTMLDLFLDKPDFFNAARFSQRKKKH